MHVSEAEHRRRHDTAVRASSAAAIARRSGRTDRKWKTYAPGGERWHGFDGVRALDGLPPEILRVPLVGHTRGHHGIAMRRDGDAGWMLHAGDAYFFHGELERHAALPAAAARASSASSPSTTTRASPTSRACARSPPIATPRCAIFCAHDPRELERCRSPQ